MKGWIFMYEELSKKYDRAEVPAMEVYSDMLQFGEGYIQKERGKGGVLGTSYHIL